MSTHSNAGLMFLFRRQKRGGRDEEGGWIVGPSGGLGVPGLGVIRTVGVRRRLVGVLLLGRTRLPAPNKLDIKQILCLRRNKSNLL